MAAAGSSCCGSSARCSALNRADPIGVHLDVQSWSALSDLSSVPQVTTPKKSVTLAQGAGVAAALVTFFVTFMFFPNADGGPSKGTSMVSLGVGFLV